MMLALVLAQESAEAGSSLSAFLPLLLAVGFLALIMLPQRRMRKQQQELQASIEVGDLVRTAGGIRGRVIEVDEETVVIEVESGQLRMERRAISGKLET